VHVLLLSTQFFQPMCIRAWNQPQSTWVSIVLLLCAQSCVSLLQIDDYMAAQGQQVKRMSLDPAHQQQQQPADGAGEQLAAEDIAGWSKVSGTCCGCQFAHHSKLPCSAATRPLLLPARLACWWCCALDRCTAWLLHMQFLCLYATLFSCHAGAAAAVYCSSSVRRRSSSR
jgi:hypothetical protein